MIVKALVGPSGTGKSYRSIWLAGENGLDYIIDDGILVNSNKIIAGTSAKREKTKIGAIKRAIFEDEQSRIEMTKAIQRCNPNGILILGTSTKMADKIRTRLNLPAFDEVIDITDIASEQEIATAQKIRNLQGKHVVPVPTMEIKKTFSGYFMDPLSVFRKIVTLGEIDEDKTIVRPEYSYIGDFEINDTVLCDIALFEVSKLKDIHKIHKISIDKFDSSVEFNLDISAVYGKSLLQLCTEIEQTIKTYVEKYTSVYTEKVNIFVRDVVK